MDEASGRVLYARNATTPHYPASTTKILTGLLLLEKTSPNETIQAGKHVEEVGESSMHLKAGERVTAKNLLVAILLRSANDGCTAIADHVAGSERAFADLMNRRARELGARQTHFTNASGLHDPSHVTTAYDLALMAREAMKVPEFREVAKTVRYRIERSTNQGDLWMVSRNRLLRKDPTLDGIKTGWTIPAGRCFVGSATRNGFRVITVVLNSKDWQADTQELLGYAFRTFERKQVVRPNADLGTMPFAKVVGGEIPVASAEKVVTVAPKGESGTLTVERVPRDGLRAPVLKGAQVGYLVIRDGTGYEQRAPLLATADVAAVSPPSSKGGPWMIGMGTALIVAAMFVRDRARRRDRGYPHIERI